MVILKTFSILIDVRRRRVGYSSVRVQDSRTFFPVNDSVSLSSYHSCFLIRFLNYDVTIRLQLHYGLVLKSKISGCCIFFLLVNDFYLIIFRIKEIVFHSENKIISKCVQKSISLVGNSCNLTYNNSTVFCAVNNCLVFNVTYLFSINIVKLSIL